jgi:citrate lyase subunit beta/citryl-CoA lyase
MLRKAPRSGADTVVFDLEDAVAPDRKTAAREHVRGALAELATSGDGPGVEVCVRINPVDRGAAADLDAVLDGVPPDALVVPKVGDAADVERVAVLARERGETLPILALVESAAGVLHAEGIAAADPVDALVFGAEDLAADVGATRSDEGTEVLYAREHVVLAASAAGVDAVDTVYTDFEDDAGLREATAFARDLGYDGKLAIHPAQVGPINEAFTPDPGRVEWAERVLAAREATDSAVFEVDGEMIDAPLIAQAERIVERARAADRE